MIDWIVTSSVLILVVTALRRLLRGRISLRLQYALWAIVLLRLLLPVQLGQTPFSVLNAVEEQEELQITVSRPLFYVGETPDLAVSIPDPSLPEEVQQKLQAQLWQEYYEEMARYATPVSVSTVVRALWLAGLLVTGAVLLFSNLRFARRLYRSRRATELTYGRLPVYVSPLVDTPCLFGLFRPAVYLTQAVLQEEAPLHHVLCHEGTHYRHGDHVWAVLRGLCLALHWYNPLVWLAAGVARQDAELACDEGTLQRIGEEQRTAYGQTLIALACGKRRGELLLTATTMTSSKKSLHERITLIARGPKTTVFAVLVALSVLVTAAGCTFTGSQAADELSSIPISYTGGEELSDALRSSANTYIRSHAAILQELTSPDFVTGAEITAIRPVSLSGLADGEGATLYQMSYQLTAQDTEPLIDLSHSQEFSDMWQTQGTNGDQPVLTPVYLAESSSQPLLYFRATIYAPYSEASAAS